MLAEKERNLQKFDPEIQPLIKNLLADPQTAEVSKRIKNFLKRHPIDDWKWPIMNRLCGWVFEEIVYFHLSAYYRQYKLPYLGSHDVFELFRRQNRQRPVIDDLGLGISLGIRGIHIPDGMLMEDFDGAWHILTLFECKMSEHSLDLSHQLQAEANFLTRALRLPISPEEFKQTYLFQKRPDLYPLPIIAAKHLEAIPIFPRKDYSNPDYESPITKEDIISLAQIILNHSK